MLWRTSWQTTTENTSTDLKSSIYIFSKTSAMRSICRALILHKNNLYFYNQHNHFIIFVKRLRIESPYKSATRTLTLFTLAKSNAVQTKGQFSIVQDCFFVYTAIDCSLKNFGVSLKVYIVSKSIHSLLINPHFSQVKEILIHSNASTQSSNENESSLDKHSSTKSSLPWDVICTITL